MKKNKIINFLAKRIVALERMAICYRTGKPMPDRTMHNIFMTDGWKKEIKEYQKENRKGK